VSDFWLSGDFCYDYGYSADKFDQINLKAMQNMHVLLVLGRKVHCNLPHAFYKALCVFEELKLVS